MTNGNGLRRRCKALGLNRLCGRRDSNPQVTPRRAFGFKDRCVCQFRHARTTRAEGRSRKRRPSDFLVSNQPDTMGKVRKGYARTSGDLISYMVPTRRLD